MTATPHEQGRTTGRRRWPLLAIGASAGTATWSGWVGLGELTGFGVVHPLPGIWDDLTVNTAVTLPIGVEAYAMYALSVATTPRALPRQVRRYAWASSGAALALGMAGQVAYHVMTAHGRASGPAPWWVTALVSCLPVLVLGAASLLWHLAGQDEWVGPESDPIAEPDHGSDSGPILTPTVQIDPPPDPLPDPRSAREPGRIEPLSLPPRPEPLATSSWIARPVAAAADPPASGALVGRSIDPRESDVQRARAAIASGDLPPAPTAAAIRAHLAISPAYARATRDALRAAPEHQGPRQQPIEEIPGQEQIDLFRNAIDQSEAPTAAVTDEKPLRNAEEQHTYATPLP